MGHSSVEGHSCVLHHGERMFYLHPNQLQRSFYKYRKTFLNVSVGVTFRFWLCIEFDYRTLVLPMRHIVLLRGIRIQAVHVHLCLSVYCFTKR